MTLDGPPLYAPVCAMHWRVLSTQLFARPDMPSESCTLTAFEALSLADKYAFLSVLTVEVADLKG